MSEEKNEVGGIREVFGQFVKLPAVMDCTLSEVMCLMRSVAGVHSCCMLCSFCRVSGIGLGF